jgi:fatty acid-binding protein DegV
LIKLAPICIIIEGKEYRDGEEGCNEIIGLTMSNQVSGTNNVFRLVATEVMKENHDVRIEVIDTLSVSMGQVF